jgi:hypothetical protein
MNSLTFPFFFPPLSIKGTAELSPILPYPSSLHPSSSPVHCSTLSLVSFVAGVCRSSPELQFVAGASHSPSVVEPLFFFTRPNPVELSPSHVRTQG